MLAPSAACGKSANIDAPHAPASRASTEKTVFRGAKRVSSGASPASARIGPSSRPSGSFAGAA